jgi:hypothetical protein
MEFRDGNRAILFNNRRLGIGRAVFLGRLGGVGRNSAADNNPTGGERLPHRQR